MKTQHDPKTLVEAIHYFADPDRAFDFLVKLRWPHGVTCPACGSQAVHFLATQRRWKCRTRHARQQFSVKAGTIFEDSPLGLDKWMPAMWMIVNAKNGVSSYEIGRSLGVTQKTAWFMMHRIRLALQHQSFDKKLSGDVEADETYIGGKARNMHWDKQKRVKKQEGSFRKAVVVGMLERNGEVRCKVLETASARILQREVRANVEAGSQLFTDQLAAYKHLQMDYAHRVINHAERYVKGNVHTNGIENFWSLLKRGLKGTYVSVEPFHLFRYLDEQSFRFNTRKANDQERFTEAVSTVSGRRVTYQQLIGQTNQSAAE